MQVVIGAQHAQLSLPFREAQHYDLHVLMQIHVVSHRWITDSDKIVNTMNNHISCQLNQMYMYMYCDPDADDSGKLARCLQLAILCTLHEFNTHVF